MNFTKKNRNPRQVDLFEQRFFDTIYDKIKEHEYKPKDKIPTYTAKGVIKQITKSMAEFNERPIWKIVERLNFDRSLAAWEEHLLKEGVSFNEAKEFIDRNKGRVLFAYIPHYSGVGMEAMICNEKYANSVKLERKYAKLID